MNSNNNHLLSEEEILNNCSRCKNRGFDPKFGLVCSLTKERPHYDYECPDYLVDSKMILKPRSTSDVYTSNESSPSIGRIILNILGILYFLFKLIRSIYLERHFFIFLYLVILIILILPLAVNNKKD